MGHDKNLIFIEGTNVDLKVLDEKDLLESDWVRWFNSEERCRNNQHHYFPTNYEIQKKYLAEAISDTKIQLGVIDKFLPGSICGVISLQQINLINRNAEMAIMLDERTKAKPIIFAESWSLLMRHGFEQLGLNKIYSGAINPEIHKLLNNLFNFIEEGKLLRHIYKNNEYVDVTLSAVFKETVKYRA